MELYFQVDRVNEDASASAAYGWNKLGVAIGTKLRTTASAGRGGVPVERL